MLDFLILLVALYIAYAVTSEASRIRKGVRAVLDRLGERQTTRNDL